MPTFTCQSIGPEGRLIEVKINAATRATAFEQLRAKGHLPVSAAEAGVEQHGQTTFFTLERRKITDKELLAITKELSLMLGASQQLEQALSLIAGSAPSSRVGQAITTILELVRGGTSFAEALEEQGSFPPLYIAMIRAGEASGSLDQAVERMAQRQ
jgi:general secretion pathway protein F